jgi:chemotaxis protein methyltransferase CheR
MAELAAALQSADAPVRRAALQAASAADVVDPSALYTALGDRDASVRKEASRLAARAAQNPKVMQALERALCDESDVARRSAAMDALANIGAHAVPLLGRLARDPRTGVRRLAVDALGFMRRPEALPALTLAARDDAAAVRAAALEALSRIGGKDVEAQLLAVLERVGESAAVVLAALIGLQNLQVVPPLFILRRHLADALTAPPALRLLGRAGQADELLAEVLSSRGSRQRAALLGLADALERAPLPRLLDKPEANVIAVLAQYVRGSDVHVAGAALLVAAHAGVIQALVDTATRDDRAALLSVAHRAVAIFERRVPRFIERLEAFAADDGPGAYVLAELAEGARRRRGNPVDELTQPGVPPPAPPPAAQPVRARALTPALLSRLASILETTAGLAIDPDAATRLEARLLPRVWATGAADFGHYLDIISRDDEPGRRERLAALELVTIHETYFFREKQQLDGFRDEVLPELLAQSSTRSTTLRMWSAGCASGEEAYTLAILLAEAGVPSWDILGTDLGEGVLEKAQQARYGPRSFRGDISPEIRKRWFIHTLDGVMVHPDARRGVRFKMHNLLDDSALLPTFDVIFCRNVLIYLGAAARERVVKLFHARLRPGGFLFLGHSESLLHVETPFRLRPLGRGVAYQRPLP